MKKAPLILSVLLCGWIMGGSMLYMSLFCSAPGHALSIIVDGIQIVYANQHIAFHHQSDKPVISTPTQEALQQIADYIIEHPQKVLQLSIYDFPGTTENNAGNPLTQRRASALQSIFEELGVNAKQISAFASTNSEIILKNNIAYNTASIEVVDFPIEVLNIKDGSNFISSSENSFSFHQHHFEIANRLDNGLKAALNSLSEYLINHPDRRLIINGAYHDSERNPSIYPNLGVARAIQVKNLFSRRGISGKQLASWYRKSGASISGRFTHQ